MAEGHAVEDGGKRWTIRLRDGLLFHDGEPVRGRDCVASLRRWMKRDSFGQSVAAVLDALEAPDDRTLVFRLRQPFPPLLKALAKSQPSPAFIMPERVAATDPFKQITEVVGSGPFRFVPDEYVAGSRSVYARVRPLQAAGRRRRAAWRGARSPMSTGSSGRSSRRPGPPRMRCAPGRSTGWRCR